MNNLGLLAACMLQKPWFSSALVTSWVTFLGSKEKGQNLRPADDLTTPAANRNW